MAIRRRSNHQPDAQTRVINPEHCDERADHKEDDLSEYENPGFDFRKEALGDGGGEKGESSEGDE